MKTNKLIMILVILFISGCIKKGRMVNNMYGVLPFPICYSKIENTNDSTKLNYYYIIGTQYTESTFPYILETIIDTLQLDSNRLNQEFVFLRYKEGLPTLNPFDKEWEDYGQIEDYYLLSISVNNKKNTIELSYHDGKNLKGICVIPINEFKIGGRQKLILERLKYVN